MPLKYFFLIITFVIFCFSNKSSIAEQYLAGEGPQQPMQYNLDRVSMGEDNIVHWANLNHKYDPDNYWQEFSKDIDWYLNYTGTDLTTNEVRDLCINAYSTWSAPNTVNVNFVYSGTTSSTYSNTDGKNVLFWAGANHDIFDFVGDKNWMGITLISFDSDEELYDVDIAFNDWEGPSPYPPYGYIPISWSDGTSTVDPNGYISDVQTEVLHETGHLIGLGHSDYPSRVVMTAGWTPDVERTLFTDDIIGASFVCGGKIIESLRQFDDDQDYYFDWPITIVSGAALKFRADYQEFPEFWFSNYGDEFCVTVESGGEFICDSYSNSLGTCLVDLGGKTTSRGIRILDGGSATIDRSHLFNGFYGVILCESGELDLQNCYILDCTHGLFLNYLNFSSEDPVIKNNNITYCTSGIYFHQSGGTGSNIQNNTIENCSSGIKFSAGSSPILISSQNHNNIRNNNYGLNAWMGCSPFFSYNNIENCSVYSAKATYYSNLTAEYNYWGSSDPTYYTYRSSSFDYLPKLSGPLTKSVSSTLSGGTEIEQLKNLIYANENEAAKVKCKEIISQFSDSPKSIIALSLLWELSRRDDADQFKSYLKSLCSKDEKMDLNGFAEIILAGYEKAETKIEKIDHIQNKYDSDNIKQLALFVKYCHYLLEENDRKKVHQLESEISSKYPNSELYNNVLFLAGKPEIEVIEKDIIKEPSAENNSLPLKFSLLDNYPNPFNPYTKIRYQLAENEKVSIKIYNMQGREVATLVNKYKEKGYHDVSWDARSYGSGVYYYRIVAGSYCETKKMILLK